MEIIIDNDDKLYTRSYIEQHAKFTSLSADLKSPKAVSALKTMHLSSWFAKMAVEIAEIQTLIAERDKSESGKEIPTDKEAKATLQKAITHAVEDLQSLSRRNRVNALDTTLGEIDQVIKRINANAKARRTRKNNQDDKEEE